MWYQLRIIIGVQKTVPFKRLEHVSYIDRLDSWASPKPHFELLKAIADARRAIYETRSNIKCRAGLE